MKREAKMVLLLSDARGQYIPRDFANEVKRECISGVSSEDLDYLALGPDDIDEAHMPIPGQLAHDASFYWDTWSDVLDRAVITDTDGMQYFVYQDGDCWLIEKGAEFADRPIDGIDTDWYVDDGVDSEEVQS